MYGENTKTIAIPIYRVLPYPVIHVHFVHVHMCYIFLKWNIHVQYTIYVHSALATCTLVADNNYTIIHVDIHVHVGM